MMYKFFSLFLLSLSEPYSAFIACDKANAINKQEQTKIREQEIFQEQFPTIVIFC